MSLLGKIELGLQFPQAEPCRPKTTQYFVRWIGARNQAIRPFLSIFCDIPLSLLSWVMWVMTKRLTTGSCYWDREVVGSKGRCYCCDRRVAVTALLGPASSGGNDQRVVVSWWPVRKTIKLQHHVPIGVRATDKQVSSPILTILFL